MTLLKKVFIYSICIAFLSMHITSQVLAGYYAQNNSGASITEKAPQVMSTPPQDIPFIEEAKKKGGNKMLYIAGGGIALIALIAAALGGGGGGGGGGGDDDDDDDGGIGITW